MNSSELLFLDLSPRESSSLHNTPKNARKASPMTRGSPSSAGGKDKGVLKRTELLDYSQNVWVSRGKTHGEGIEKGGNAQGDSNLSSKARELLLKEELKAASVSNLNLHFCSENSTTLAYSRPRLIPPSI
jgi:hypothetical protein